eukprot:GHVN01049525.1.p1 GENE.GHVN01049525.1~~GHVN01049525.1.p1  ORF type:complete len:255 (+),score=97.13 GHVN01049525.1:71-835(+)
MKRVISSISVTPFPNVDHKHDELLSTKKRTKVDCTTSHSSPEAPTSAKIEDEHNQVNRPVVESQRRSRKANRPRRFGGQVMETPECGQVKEEPRPERHHSSRDDATEDIREKDLRVLEATTGVNVNDRILVRWIIERDLEDDAASPGESNNSSKEGVKIRGDHELQASESTNQPDASLSVDGNPSIVKSHNNTRSEVKVKVSEIKEEEREEVKVTEVKKEEREEVNVSEMKEEQREERKASEVKEGREETEERE